MFFLETTCAIIPVEKNILVNVFLGRSGEFR